MALSPSRRDTIGPPPRDVSDLARVVRHQGSYLRSLDPGLLDGLYATPRPVPRVPSQLVGDDGGDGGTEIAFENADRATASAAGRVTLHLTHEPIDGSLHIYWGPSYQRPSKYALDGQTVTFVNAHIHVGDVLSAAYAYYPDDALDFVTEVRADSPILWATHGESGGTTLTDDSGLGHAGTYQGAVSLGHPALAPGLPGTSVDFAGTGWGQVAAAAWQSPAHFSAETWVQFASVGSVQYLMGVDNAGALGLDRSWAMSTTGVGGNSEAHIICPFGATYLAVAPGLPSAFSPGLPFQVGMTFDGTTVRHFINGTEVASDTSPGAMNASAAHPLTIGASSGSVFGGEYGIVQGRQQHSILFDHVLDGDRFMAHYLAGIDG